MRYNRAERLIQLALEMQAARGGLTINDIMDRFDVSRRTAIRMRDAVIRAFPRADEVPSNDRTKRWRLNNGATDVLAGITANDLATLETAAQAFANANLPEHSENLRALSAKVRGLLKDQEIRRIEPDLEVLLEAEGLAHRPGPRALIPGVVFDILREAIKSCRKVSFEYSSRTGKSTTRRTVAPIGFLYGHRHYLVALQEGTQKPKFFSLPFLTKLKIEPDGFMVDPSFKLKELVSHSFGVFEEEPVDVAWRFSSKAAPLARTFIFHHSQSIEEEPDGTLLVRFRAGGLLEMAWHLISWGDQVEVISPTALRELLPERAQSWPALP